MVMTTKNYSPGGVAKKGDLFIYTSSSWKLIPSGDDDLGTVTSITAGAGLSITSFLVDLFVYFFTYIF